MADSATAEERITAAATAETEDATVESVATRHRRERKELQAKIQELKKNAPKSDKKKRKEANEQVTRMETDMETRHATELKAAEERAANHQNDVAAVAKKLQNTALNGDVAAPTEQQNEANDTAEDGPKQRVTKAQKRRDKKEREARQLQEDIRLAAEEAQFAPKAIELQQIKDLLRERELALCEIPSDGDCLYNAIRHQVRQNLGLDYSVRQLRHETANYIRANKGGLICYMTHPQTGDLLSDDEFELYCRKLESTPAWGGQVELKALSSILRLPIEVLQAEGPPTVQGKTEFGGSNLIIVYHRHMYSLGEHYNSTMPLEAEADGSGGEGE